MPTIVHTLLFRWRCNISAIENCVSGYRNKNKWKFHTVIKWLKKKKTNNNWKALRKRSLVLEPVWLVSSSSSSLAMCMDLEKLLNLHRCPSPQHSHITCFVRVLWKLIDNPHKGLAQWEGWHIRERYKCWLLLYENKSSKPMLPAANQEGKCLETTVCWDCSGLVHSPVEKPSRNGHPAWWLFLAFSR